MRPLDERMFAETTMSQPENETFVFVQSEAMGPFGVTSFGTGAGGWSMMLPPAPIFAPVPPLTAPTDVLLPSGIVFVIFTVLAYALYIFWSSGLNCPKSRRSHCSCADVRAMSAV